MSSGFGTPVLPTIILNDGCRGIMVAMTVRAQDHAWIQGDLALARSLAMEPPLTLFDEPISALEAIQVL